MGDTESVRMDGDGTHAPMYSDPHPMRRRTPVWVVAFTVVFGALVAGWLAWQLSAFAQGTEMYYWEAKRRMKYIQFAEREHFRITGRYTQDTAALGNILAPYIASKRLEKLNLYQGVSTLPLTRDSVWRNPCSTESFIIAVDSTGERYQIRDAEWRIYGYIGSWTDKYMFDTASWEVAGR